MGPGSPAKSVDVGREKRSEQISVAWTEAFLLRPFPEDLRKAKTLLMSRSRLSVALVT